MLARMRWLVACAALVVVACGTGEREPQGVPGSSAASGGGTTSTGAGGGGMAPVPTRATVSGEITWTVTFDETAKAAGATDCTYTRQYQGVEDRSAPWLCPACEVMFRADVQIRIEMP